MAKGESRIYSGVLNLRVENQQGVIFGRLNNVKTFIDVKERDSYPARITLPHAVWEAEGYRKKVVVSLKFVDDDVEMSIEDVFLLNEGANGKKGKTQAIPKKKPAQRQGKRRTA